MTTPNKSVALLASVTLAGAAAATLGAISVLEQFGLIVDTSHFGSPGAEEPQPYAPMPPPKHVPIILPDGAFTFSHN